MVVPAKRNPWLYCGEKGSEYNVEAIYAIVMPGSSYIDLVPSNPLRRDELDVFESDLCECDYNLSGELDVI